MEKKLNNKLGKMILGSLIVMITTSAYASTKCETTVQCSGGVCSEISICTTIPELPPIEF